MTVVNTLTRNRKVEVATMTKNSYDRSGLLFELPGLSRMDQITMTMDQFDNWLDYEVEEYTGDLVAGERNGHGTGRWSDGKVYVGDWRNGDRHGHGMVTWPNGQKYIGEWQGDFASGKAVLSKADGSAYAGEFVDSQRHGIGTQAYPNGAVYTGGWKDDHPEGWGVIRTAEGRQVMGRLEINQRHGRGVQFFENGNDDDNNRVYWEEGEFIDQAEWFTREQVRVFAKECLGQGIPFSEGSKLSDQEKIYVLSDITDVSLNDLEEFSGLAMMAMAHVFKTEVMQADCCEDGELAGLLASGLTGIDAFCSERNLSPAIRERLLLWSDWSKSEERQRVEAFLREKFVNQNDDS